MRFLQEEHWSRRLLRRGVSVTQISERLKESFLALGVVAALAGTMAFEALISVSEDDFTEKRALLPVMIALTIAFGLAMYAVVHTIVLVAGINQLPEEDMLKVFIETHSHEFPMTTTIPFQVAFIMLMIAIVIKTVDGGPNLRILAGVQLVFFAFLTKDLFGRFFRINQQAHELHDAHFRRLEAAEATSSPEKAAQPSAVGTREVTREALSMPNNQRHSSELQSPPAAREAEEALVSQPVFSSLSPVRAREDPLKGKRKVASPSRESRCVIC